jgi:hypothetical protein
MRYFVICAIGYFVSMLLLALAVRVAEKTLRQIP